jgi:protein involved in polysaccharide export with SLBB domain
MRRIFVGIIALGALANGALAQPFPSELPTESQRPPSTTRMPVTAPQTTQTNPGDEPMDPTEPRAVDPVLAQPFVPPPVSLEQPIDPEHYVCGAGDVFELNFWGPQNLRLRLIVDLEGRAFIPKVGYVAVANKTLSAVRTAMKSRVRANYPGLSFDLAVEAPRTFLVHVVENVKRPGTFSAHAIDRVSAVIARAGVIAAASRRRITIHHRTGADATADLVKYELTGDAAFDPYLLDGDVVHVPFPELQVKVTGAVRRPGPYELIAAKDLAEVLELAGGLAPTAAKALPIRIVRRNGKQQEQYIDVPVGGNAPLADDDRVVVRGTEDLQRSVLLIGAIIGSDPLDSATTSRRLPFVEGDTVWSLIDRAGGIKAPGDLSRSYIARPNANGQDLIAIDLDALLVRRDFKADKPIGMGDTIVIPPMQYSVMVEGAVGRAGLYNYNPMFGVPEYVAHAGGLSRNARDLDEVRLIRANGSTRDYKAGMKLVPGDAILVPERNFSRAEVTQLILATAGLVLSGVAIVIAARR